MVKIPVYLRDMYDAKHLVQIAESCRGGVDLLCGRYVVDAKSMLGVFSLPTFEQVEIGVGAVSYTHLTLPTILLV